MAIETLDMFIEEYGGPIYRFCLKLTHSREDADDLYQETFIKVYENLNKCNEAENQKGYLFSICINTWKSNHRKYASLRKSAEVTELGDAMLIDAGVDVEDFVIAREQVRQIQRIAATLDDKHRVPLYLHYAAELTIPEIAQVLKVPEGTVKSRLYKARATIQKRWEVSHHEQSVADRGSLQTGAWF